MVRPAAAATARLITSLLCRPSAGLTQIEPAPALPEPLSCQQLVGLVHGGDVLSAATAATAGDAVGLAALVLEE